MSKLLAFIKKDLLEEVSYRFKLILGLIGMCFSVLMFYFLAKTFGGSMSPYLQRYGGDYFPYVLTGIAVSNFVTFGLSALSHQIRSAQVMGTLEALVNTPTSIYTILIGNSLWSFLKALVSAVLLIGVGLFIVRVEVTFAAVAASILILLLTFLAFLAIGMLSASFVVIFKRGDPIEFIFGWSSFILGGVLFPVEVLPKPLAALSVFLPITHAVRGIRELLLAGTPVMDIGPLIRNLCLFIVVFGPVGILIFRFAVYRAKKDGNLIQY